LGEKYIKIFKMRAKTVYESISFERGKDPKSSMGIGKRALIEKWFRTWVPDVKYMIDDNLNIIVGGDLWLRGTQITELPDNLRVGGSLDLAETQITKLPDNLRVGGDLYLQRTQITELPDNLSVGGWLDLKGTQITELPDNLRVGGKIYKDF